MPSPTPANGPSPIDLTTLAYLQNYLAFGTSTADSAQLQRLITAASQTILTYTGRKLFVYPFSETYDGTGTALLTLKNWPIVAVTLVEIYASCGPWGGGGFQVQPVFPVQPQVIPPSQNGQPGYIFDPSAGTIILIGGYSFAYGTRNVKVNYVAGFTETFPENQTVTAGTVTLNNQSAFVQDFGVVYATGPSAGTALTLVASSPAQGQYTVTPLGVYGFNAADNTVLVTVTYQFSQPPYDLQDACCEIAAVEYRRIQHLDQDSQAMVEATTNFSRLSIPRLAQLRLDQYKNRLPAM